MDVKEKTDRTGKSKWDPGIPSSNPRTVQIVSILDATPTILFRSAWSKKLPYVT